MTTKLEETRFVVEGRGMFPIDMLRYDQCFPLTQDAARGIEFLSTYQRRVELVARGPAGTTDPTIGRWRSFMWEVVEVNGFEVVP